MLDISVYLTDHCPACGFCVRNQHEEVISLFMLYLMVLIKMLVWYWGDPSLLHSEDLYLYCITFDALGQVQAMFKEVPQ